MYILLLCVTGILLPGRPALASDRSHPMDWGQHDTAVYVVSTLNVLHTRRGKPVVSLITRRMAVNHFEVWDDLNGSDLYFVVLKRDSAMVGQMAYQMGWSRPMSLSTSMERLGVRRAPDKVVEASKTDPRQLIGTFASTLPR